MRSSAGEKRSLSVVSEDITMAAAAGKSSRRGPYDDNNAAAVVVDRLSCLPDNVLHHILSFLATKRMVQTSILSRRWRCLWKEVTSLNFRYYYSHPDGSRFKDDARKLLSLRSSSAAISSVTLGGFRAGQLEEALLRDVLDRIMERAACSLDSRRLLHLSVSLEGWDRGGFADLAASVRAHRHHESLDALKLEGFELELRGRGSELDLAGFKALTNLELRGCRLFYYATSTSGPAVMDPFADFPCLQRLKLVNCEQPPHCSSLRVSGLELLDVEMEYPMESSRCPKIEVLAPKLRSFCFSGGTEQLTGLNLPPRVRTEIHAQPRQRAECDFEEYYDEKFMSEIKEQRRQKALRAIPNWRLR